MKSHAEIQISKSQISTIASAASLQSMLDSVGNAALTQICAMLQPFARASAIASSTDGKGDVTVSSLTEVLLLVTRGATEIGGP